MTIPLGKPTSYPDRYAPDLLAPIARSDSRTGIESPLPFTGRDIWTAWELTWLRNNGRPEIAAAVISVPAESPNIVESKSLKLYLNSFAMTRFADASDVRERIRADLGDATGGPVDVSLLGEKDHRAALIGKLPGFALDALDVACDSREVDAGLLSCADDVVSEDWHTHLFRSLCPVTAQPDLASVYVAYTGPKIDPGGLLQYLVSFRDHQDFHEACIERMFVDIDAACSPQKLCVYARFQRRGGIDINPWRANYDTDLPNVRLWRQ